MPFVAFVRVLLLAFFAALGCSERRDEGPAQVGTVRQALAPTLSGFTPTSGAVGTNVVITGFGLIGTTDVGFGSSPDSSPSATFVVNSDTQITAVVPVSARSGSLFLRNADGIASSTLTFQVLSSGPPTIGSFNPTTGGVGSFTRISGTNFAGTTAVSFSGVPSSTFYIEGQGSIAAYVPDGATSGPIAVTNSVGTATSGQSFTVIPKPVVSSISPSAGAPGATVVLSGTGFIGATEVRFGADSGASVAAVFTVDSGSQITATVPSGFSSGSVRVEAPGGTAYSPPFTALSNQVPTVTSFTPTSGARDSEVRVLGSGFTGTTSVSFAGSPAQFELVADGELRTFVPDWASSGPISVTNSLGTGASAQSFTVIPPPTVTGFSPASGAVGSTVVLTGTAFSGATSVTFGVKEAGPQPPQSGGQGVQAVFTVNGPTQITATVPSGAPSGPISVRTPSGEGISPLSFTVLSSMPPVVTGFSPTSGGVGSDVVILGSSFTGTTSVSFAGLAGSFTLVSDVEIRATVPGGAASGPITVTNTLGSSISSQSFAVIPPPVITAVSPGSGAPGASVVLTGSGFTGATAVFFGGDGKQGPGGTGGGSSGSSASFTVNGDGQLTVTVPFGAVSGPITVEALGGFAESPMSFTVLSATVPSITSLSPSSGGERSPVRILGTGFTGTTGVSFAGTPATYFSLVSDGEISTSVPPGAASGLLTVTNTLGSDSADFTVLPPPAITGFAPASGLPGASVLVTGSGFTGATEVLFSSGLWSGGTGGTGTGDPKPQPGGGGGASSSMGGAPAVFTVLSDTQITAAVPFGAVTGPLTVLSLSGSGVSSASFVVQSPGAPTITAISPTSGGQGSPVSIFGTAFTGATSVSFAGVSATSYWLQSDTHLEAFVPQGAASGPITVTNSVGQATSAQTFTVIPPPTITSLSPSTGPAGTSVTITGTGFLGTEWVHVGDGPGASFVVVNDTTLTAIVPPGARSGSVEVRTRYGSARSAQPFVVQSSAPPTITSFSPGSGLPGTMVEITGSGFTGVIDVQFSSTDPDSGAGFQVESETRLRVWVPDSAVTGPITVTNTLGSAISAASFVLLPPPVVTGFSPTSGRAGDAVTVTGSGFSAVQRVQFNDKWADFDILSDDRLVAWVPDGATTGPISVGGTETAQSFTVFSTSAPTITAFFPTSGYPGQFTQLSGSGFTGTTAVEFAGTPASSFWVEWDGTLLAYVPDGAVTGPIRVTNTIGTAVSSTDFTVVPPPSIAGFSPATGAPGTTVVITGTALSSVTEVRFSNAFASFTVDSATQITAVVPPNAVTGPIRLDRENQSATDFVVLSSSAPTVTGFAPPTGGTDAPVTVTGKGFAGAIAVAFGGVPAAFRVGADSALVAFVPFGASTGPISVTNNVGTGASTASFVVVPPPTITGVSPGTGTEGDSVVITGTGFAGTTEVRFGTIGGIDAAFTVNSPTQITAVVPPGAVTNPIQIRSPSGSAISPSSFNVVAKFAPSITSFSPASGSPGSLVEVSGAGFTGVTAVTFGGAASAFFGGDSATRLFAVVPTGAVTGPITVVNALGTASSTADFVVLPGGMTVTAVTPGAGSAGTVVTITGTGLAGAGAMFSREKPAQVTSSSDTELVVTVPPGAVTGPIFAFQEGPGNGPRAVAIWPSFTVYATVCAGVPAGTPCGLCAVCAANGACTAAAADDAACGVIECDGQDGPCADRDDLTAGRCEGIGDCKDPNTVDCTTGTVTAAGTDCGTCAACNGLGACVGDTSQSAADCPPCHVCGAGPACIAVANGTSCDDGTACTSGESCQGGACGAPASVVTCTAQDACHDAGACDPATGACSNPRKPDGTACSDGFACTLGDFCSAGTCGFVDDQCPCTSDADCGPPNPCHDQGVCNLATRTCTPRPRGDGTRCDDGNACTTGETCQAGACGVPTAAVTCVALDACHDRGVCDPTTGTCTDPIQPDGSPCTDGFGCTTGDACRSGVCVPAADLCPCATDADCPPRDQCEQAGACDGATRLCVRPVRPDGTSCDDGSACTSGETCQTGACGAPAATLNCAELDGCHDAGTCDPATGLCTNPAKADGTSCDDGLACTTADHCEAGACALGTDGCDCTANGDCQRNDQCQDPGTCDLPTRRCAYPNKPDGAPCNDADACTLGESCQAGVCGAPTSAVSCVPTSACLDTGTCAPATGQCLYPGAVNGSACSDGLACTSGDTCQGGSCVPSARSCICATDADCVPLDPCHEGGACDPVTRLCSNPARPDGTPCDDADQCTLGEICQAGACGAPTSTVSCPAPSECHAQATCERATGACDSPPLADGTSCATGTCQSGACVAAPDGGGQGAGGSANADAGVGSGGSAGADSGNTAPGGSTGVDDGGATGGAPGSAAGGSGASAGGMIGGGAAGASTADSGIAGGTAEAGDEGDTPAARDEGGCGCRTAGAGAGGHRALLLVLLAGVAWQRRARRRTGPVAQGEFTIAGTRIISARKATLTADCAHCE